MLCENMSFVSGFRVFWTVPRGTEKPVVRVVRASTGGTRGVTKGKHLARTIYFLFK
jgi:hypothetical protein